MSDVCAEVRPEVCRVRQHVISASTHFARYLPAGMTWDEFDTVLLRSITAASIDQWWNGTGSFVVWTQNCEKWLAPHLDVWSLHTVSYCVNTGFRRLLMQRRVRSAALHDIGLSPIVPLPPYPLDAAIVQRQFPKPWLLRPVAPEIGWAAFKTLAAAAFDTLLIYGRLDDPPCGRPRYGEVLAFLQARGWDRQHLSRVLPPAFSMLRLENDRHDLPWDAPEWHPALVR